ncbi:MAG: exosortase/archaeosortase family protein [Candidatus Spyradosoma sp.]
MENAKTSAAAPADSLPPLAYAGVALVACAVLLFDQVQCWNAKDDYLFGYLVPLFAAFVVRERWDKIRRVFTGTPDADDADDEFTLPAWAAKPGARVPAWLNWIFGAGTLASALLFAAGAIGSAIYGFDAFTTYENTAGFVGLCFGLAWFAGACTLSGTRNDLRTRARLPLLLLFPICVWLISGPFTFLVDRQIKTLLLSNVTATVVALLNFLGFDLAQEANTILLPGGDRVGVEDACSGVRSLTACLFTGSFLAAVFMRTLKKKIFFVAVSIVFALLLNVLRSGFLTVWSSFKGSEALELDFFGNAADSPAFTLGTVHDVVGWGAMFVTLGLLAALVPLVNLKLEKTDEEMALDLVDDEE